MQAITTQKYIRMSPRKLRLVADIAKKHTPAQALEILPFLGKRAAGPLEKAIKTAVANAVNQGASKDELVFKEIQINEGPRLKRGIAVSRGQWHPIVKQMSHIRVIVETKQKTTSAKVEKESKTKETNKK